MEGPFQILEKRAGRPTAFKLTASSLLLSREGAIVVGTADGQVMHPQDTNKHEESVITVLKSKRPVTRLVLAFKGTVILALCGGELFILDAKTLSRRPALPNLKGVVDVCVNETSPVDVSLCVVTAVLPPATSPGSQGPSPPIEDGSLHLYMARGSAQFERLREIPLRGSVGTPTQACWCTPTIVCVGGTQSAALIDVKTGSLKKIPIVVDAKRGPVVLRLPNDRVLLSSAGGLGVVIDMQGFPCPNVGAIVWSSTPLALCCAGPYVLALSDEGCVEIALMDSPGQIIQTLNLSNCSNALCADFALNGPSFIRQMKEPKFNFLVGLSMQHSDTPFRLVQSLPLQDQVLALLRLDKGDCTRALNLVKEFYPIVQDQERLKEIEDLMYVRAAAMLLEQRTDYDRAFALLSIANVDVLQLLSIGGYHETVKDEEDDDERQKTKTRVIRKVIQDLDVFKDAAFRTQLRNHIVRVRRNSPSRELDTSFVLFLADVASPEDLQTFCLDNTNRCNVEFCAQRLDTLGLTLAAAHLRATHSAQISQSALEAYRSLDETNLFLHVFLKSSPEDQDSELVTQVFDANLEWMLQKGKFEDVETVLIKYAPLLLKAGEDSRRKLEDRVSASNVRKPRALLAAVYEACPIDEADASALALVLVSAIEEALHLNEKKDVLSSRLLLAIERSPPSARPALEALVRSKFQSRLGRERASCLGALGRHREALRILVTELNDYEGAERYCEQHTQSSGVRPTIDADASAQIDPFAALLAIHLERFNEQSSGGARAEAAMAFLSRHASRVNPLEAVQALPESLPLGLAMKFLEQAILRVTQAKRSSRVEKNLARGENLQVKLKLISLEQESFIIHSYSKCSQCGMEISASDALQKVSGKADVKHFHCPVQQMMRPSPRAGMQYSASAASAMMFANDKPDDWKQLQ